MKRQLLLLMLITLVLSVMSFAAVSVVGAQDCQDAAGGPIECPDSGGGGGDNPTPDSADPDGDGTVAPFDRCPTTSGPNNNGGCPVGDDDGDGIANESDTCPLEAGAVGGNGCPPATEEPSSTDATPVPGGDGAAPANIALPEIPADGRCMVGTAGQTAVNVRVQPDQNAAVVGALDPSQTYAVVLQWMGPDGLWYRIANPAGWVFSGVTRIGGNCDGIQTLDPAGAASGQGAIPKWGPNGEITFCLADPLDQTSCATFLPDTRDGGLIVMAHPGGTEAPPENPFMHKFLLVGEDGLLVLTAPPPADPTAMHWDFPLWFSLCPVDVDPVDCELMMNGHALDTDLPIAACAFDNDALIQCDNPNTPDGAPAPDGLPLDSVRVNYFPFDPELPIAACAYDDDKIIQCDDETDANGATYDPDLPFAACAFNNDLIIQCANPNSPQGATFDPDLPIAGCAFDNDKLVQCSNNEDAGSVGIFSDGEFFLLIGGTSGPMPQTREHILLARQVGVPAVALIPGDFDMDGDVDSAMWIPTA